MTDNAQAIDPTLLEEAEAFAPDIADLLNATVCEDVPIQAIVGQQGQVLVGAYDQSLRHLAIPLHVRETRRIDLKIHHQCSWDFTGKFLAVEESAIAVLRARERDPLIRFHYERRRAWAPAHVHVHAQRDVVGFLLAGRDPSKPPTFRSLHLPVGGRRFRPSIEDVIEFAIEEFGITARRNWRDHVRDRRQEWREIQLAAALRDVLRADPDRLRAHLHDIVDRAHDEVMRDAGG